MHRCTTGSHLPPPPAPRRASPPCPVPFTTLRIINREDHRKRKHSQEVTWMTPLPVPSLPALAPACPAPRSPHPSGVPGLCEPQPCGRHEDRGLPLHDGLMPKPAGAALGRVGAGRGVWWLAQAGAGHCTSLSSGPSVRVVPGAAAVGGGSVWGCAAAVAAAAAAGGAAAPAATPSPRSSRQLGSLVPASEPARQRAS